MLEAASELEKVAREIRACTRCPLHATRRNAVPGEGNPNARVMLVGEAPGYNEDVQGRPFVGAAGNLLNELLGLAGLRREEVFITNVVKCRPPENRDPRDEEIDACTPYLIMQIEIIKPSILVCLGRHSASTIFKLGGIEFSSIMKVRGSLRRLRIAGIDMLCLPTLHPAAALYNPRLRGALEADFKRLKDLVSREGGGLDRWL
ncbi:MAG: type-4 uracil-DNA glycosylase [Thermofilaceae archaeon]